ncbi:MAG: hypothetical protein RAM36_00480 [Arsenophonus sp.]|nr:hypothetical protein [Arsenophonus sp.]
MKLQLARNLEHFFSLFNHRIVEISTAIECHWPPFGLRIEIIEERFLITSWLLKEGDFDLLSALKLNQPERFLGIPQRVFIIRHRPYVSTWCPKESDGLFLFRLCQRQRQFLSQLPKGAA